MKRPTPALTTADRAELADLLRQAATHLDDAHRNRLLALHHRDQAGREQDRRTAGGAQHQLQQARAQLRAARDELAELRRPCGNSGPDAARAVVTAVLETRRDAPADVQARLAFEELAAQGWHVGVGCCQPSGQAVAAGRGGLAAEAGS